MGSTNSAVANLEKGVSWKLYAVWVILGLFLLLIVSIVYLGYAITIVCSVTFVALIISIVLGRNEIWQVLHKNMNKCSLVALFVIIIFFILFASFLRRTELIFFDEQIYQSIAINILNHGNALTCMFGTAQLKSCYFNSLGFDPNGWPFIIAIAFGLFGKGVSTAYNLEIAIGAISILLVFILASVLTNKKEVPIISALVFALIPELFIWSKTPANPDMPFMLFTLLTILFFILFSKKRTKITLALWMFGLIITAYIRVEALLLIPVFALMFFTFGEDGVRQTFIKRIKIIQSKNTIYGVLPLLIIFFVLITPELYVIAATRHELLINALPFLNSGGQLFSLSYLSKNVIQNSLFLGGIITEYPIIFLPEISVFAIIGVVYLALYAKQKNRIGVLVLLLCLFFCYFIFYGFYFSGSALLGGSVRFFLILYPPLSILAAFGIYGIGNGTSSLLSLNKNQYKARYLVCSVLIIIFFVLPFTYAIPFLTHPNYSYSDFPTIPNTTPQNDPYSMMYANRSLAFIDNNYNLVPASCLVFSPSPYLWYGLNRSATYTYVYNTTSAHIKGYSCFVLDYSYFCNPLFNNTGCNTILTKYKTKVLATEGGDGEQNFTLYTILNYTSS
jgi:hypothetical protein